MPSKNKIKNFIREIRVEHDKRIADSLGGGEFFATFTGATSIAGGTSGMVPAPAAGNNKYFLRGDGTWARTDEGTVVLDTVASGIEGALWKDLLDDKPVLKLRHGDYEYNFQYDELTYLGSATPVAETVEPDTYILGNDSVSSEGGVWYEVFTSDAPRLWFHSGSFNYGINYDIITYKGGNQNLVCYFPFDMSTTADACENSWTANGTLSISDSKLLVGNGGYLLNSTISDSIGSDPWTIDFWLASTSGNPAFFGTFNALGSGTDKKITVSWYWEYPTLSFGSDGTVSSSQKCSTGTRYHYAVTYDGETVRLFINGILVASKVISVQLSGDFVIGADANKANSMVNCTVDHFRIFKGRALWTENFTPPTASDYS